MDTPTMWTTGGSANRLAALPRGLVGRFGGRVMARGNRAAQHEVVDLLALGPGDRVLEVGHGPGVFLNLLESVGVASVAGADPSPEMRAQAAKRAPGAEIRAGTAESLPFDDAAFDRIISINNVAIWPSLKAGIAELVRVTRRPGGTIAISWHSARSPVRMHRSMALDQGRLNQIRDALAEHGATVTQHELAHQTCLLARWSPTE